MCISKRDYADSSFLPLFLFPTRAIAGASYLCESTIHCGHSPPPAIGWELGGRGKSAIERRHHSTASLLMVLPYGGRAWTQVLVKSKVCALPDKLSPNAHRHFFQYSNGDLMQPFQWYPSYGYRAILYLPLVGHLPMDISVIYYLKTFTFCWVIYLLLSIQDFYYYVKSCGESHPYMP